MLAFKWSNLFSIFDKGGIILFCLLSGDETEDIGGGTVGGTGGWDGGVSWTGICNFNCGLNAGIVIVEVVIGGDGGVELFWLPLYFDWLSCWVLELGYK